MDDEYDWELEDWRADQARDRQERAADLELSRQSAQIAHEANERRRRAGIPLGWV